MRHDALNTWLIIKLVEISAPLFGFGEGFGAGEGLNMQQAPNATDSAEVAGNPQLIGISGRLYLGSVTQS